MILRGRYSICFLSCFLILSLLSSLSLSAAEQPVTRFAYLTDLHVSPGNANATALEQAVDEINHFPLPLDGTLVGGDLTNAGNNAELDTVKQALDRLQKPCIVVSGNHETNWSESAGQYFRTLFAPEGECFRTTLGAITIVGFPSGPSLKMGFGVVKREDLLKLENLLNEIRQENSDARIVALTHYPLDGELGNWETVADLLKQAKTSFILGGHYHTLKLCNYDGLPGILGRSLEKDGTFGYQIVEISEAGVVTLREKQLGKPLSVPPEITLTDDHAASLSGVGSIARKPEVSVSEADGFFTQLQLSSSLFTGIALGDHAAYVGSSEGDLLALELDEQEHLTGEIRFRKSFDNALFSTPLFYENLVIQGTAGSAPAIVAVDSRSGKTVWEIPTQFPVVNQGTISDGVLYMGLGGRTFSAIEPVSGQILWQNDCASGIFQGAPAVSEQVVVTGAWDRHLYALDRRDGKLLWKWNNGRAGQLLSPGNVVPAIFQEKLVIFVAPDRAMTALNLADGKELWRVKNPERTVRESLASDPLRNRIYAKTMNGFLLAVEADPAQYQEAFFTDLGFGYEHAPCPGVVFGDTIAFGSASGKIALADAQTGALRQTIACGNSAVNFFTVSPSGKLFFTMIEGKIFGFSPVATAPEK